MSAELQLGIFGKMLGVRWYCGRYLCNEEHLHNLTELGKIVPSWGSFSVRWVMKYHAELELGVPGRSLWMREYWDRYIRNEEHLHRVIEYIHQNPVKARLCQFPESWRWSSAYSATDSPNETPQKENDI